MFFLSMIPMAGGVIGIVLGPVSVAITLALIEAARQASLPGGGSVGEAPVADQQTVGS